MKTFPKAGQFIVIIEQAFNSKADKPMYGYVQYCDKQIRTPVEINSKPYTGVILRHTKEFVPILGNTVSIFPQDWKVIPKYAVAGFLAMQEHQKIEERRNDEAFLATYDYKD